MDRKCGRQQPNVAKAGHECGPVVEATDLPGGLVPDRGDKGMR